MFTLADFLIFLAICLIAFYIYMTRNHNFWKNKGVAHIKPIFFFGNALDIALAKISPGKYIADLYKQFNDVPYFGFYALDRPFLVLKDPEIIKRIMIKDFNIFRDRFFYCNEKIDPIISNGLFGTKSPHWRALRMKLTPVFTSGKIKMMLPLMKTCGENLEKCMHSMSGSTLEAKEMAAKFTTDVIATCAFGIDANSFVNENSEFRVMGRKLFTSTGARSIQALSYIFAHNLVRLFKFRFMDKEAVDFLTGVFVETIKQRESSSFKRQDLIDILIELKKQETIDDEYKFNTDRLVAQAIVFFGAGHETTSSTIAFTLHELCVNPEVQTKLRAEILEVTQKHGGITYESILDMKYLQMVISETLRKYPLTPFLQRECEKDYTIPETGLEIPKGMGIMIPQHGLHWDPKHFPEPQKYDPERFSDENKHNVNQYVYLPFGNGPRSCIGERFALLSTKLGIIHIIKNFKVVKSPRTVDPLVISTSALLQAKGGVPLQFEAL